MYSVCKPALKIITNLLSQMSFATILNLSIQDCGAVGVQGGLLENVSRFLPSTWREWKGGRLLPAQVFVLHR